MKRWTDRKTKSFSDDLLKFYGAFLKKYLFVELYSGLVLYSG